MPNINLDSIMKKVTAYSRTDSGKAKMRDVIERYKKEGINRTVTGSRVMTEKDMWTAATKMIDVLRSTAQSFGLPASVMQHFDSLECTKIYKMRDGSSEIHIFFGDDLHRDSLQPENYEGARNIIAILNNGYDEKHEIENVWGKWHGVRIHGLSQRTGLQFIQQAVMDFNSNYGADYNVTAFVGEEYE